MLKPEAKEGEGVFLDPHGVHHEWPLLFRLFHNLTTHNQVLPQSCLQQSKSAVNHKTG